MSYVDGPRLARVLDSGLIGSLAVNMSGLLLQSHVTAGQDGIRTVSSQQPRGLT
jgi:hypothetical protein